MKTVFYSHYLFLEGDVILLYEQHLLKFPTYHELINTFVVKKIQKKVYIDE